MRVATFDLETTSLKGDLGRILVGSILDYNTEEIFSYTLDHRRAYDDRSVCRKIRDKLNEYHLLVGWNVLGFDLPMLKTRLAQNDMNKMNRTFYIDLMYHYRGWHGFNPRNSKLSTVAEFWGLDERKDELGVEVWTKAQAGHKESIERLVDRCESDCRLTNEVYKRTLEQDSVIAKIQRYGQ